jgi:hypothetical protein
MQVLSGMFFEFFFFFFSMKQAVFIRYVWNYILHCTNCPLLCVTFIRFLVVI